MARGETRAGDMAEAYSTTGQPSTATSPSALSGRHREMLADESGISASIIAERGYRTIKSRAELLEFKKYQRRPGF